LKVEREGQEKGFNAENPEDTEDAEKKKVAEGSLHPGEARGTPR